MLFDEIGKQELICAGKSEAQINKEVYQLAHGLFGIKKYWHKRIVRAGKNTLFPYDENPKNRIVQNNDIVFLDFGPIFEDWEADYGRTYVVGDDPMKLKLKEDIEKAWYRACSFYFLNKIKQVQNYTTIVDLLLKKWAGNLVVLLLDILMDIFLMKS